MSALVSDARAKLQKIKLTKSILDDNLNVLQRQNKDAFGPGVQLFNPHVNPQSIGTSSNVNEMRAKKLVNERICLLSEQVKYELNDELKRPKSLRPSAGLYGRRGLKKPSSVAVAKKSSATSVTGKRNVKPVTVLQKKQQRLAQTETYLDHVYGVAPHHNQRKTVFDPYIHITSPCKDTKYRSKRALENVTASRVRSEKCQTATWAPEKLPKKCKQVAYALAPPSISDAYPLQCSAIAIGPPQILDNKSEPLVIQAHKVSCHLSTETSEVTTPPASPKRKSILTPPSVKAPKQTPPPEVSKELPGNKLEPTDYLSNDDDSLPLRVQLTGGKQQVPPVLVCCPDALCALCKGLAPLSCSCMRKQNAPKREECSAPVVRIKKRQVDACEMEASAWVEQEVMARVLSEMYPCANTWKTCKQHKEAADEHDQYEGLPFVIDSGFDLPEQSLRKMVDDELRSIIRKMIFDSQPVAPPRVIIPPPPRETSATVVPLVTAAVTPLTTPVTSPRVVRQHIEIRRASTPSLTSQESDDEVIAPQQSESATFDPPTLSQVDSLTCNLRSQASHHHVTTPSFTPPLSPKHTTPPRTPTPKKITPEKKKKTPSPPPFIDPWEGAEFPLAYETRPHTKNASAPRPYNQVDDDLCDVIVRAFTPQPCDVQVQCDTSESSSDDDTTESRTDQTISEGQLVISHGELKPKKIPYLSKLMPYDQDDEDDTLHEAAPYLHQNESGSDGEINPTNLNLRIPGLPAHVPSVYARPRKQLPADGSPGDGDVVSVGEVINDPHKRDKFRKWRKKAAASHRPGDSNDGSIGEFRSSVTSSNNVSSVGGGTSRGNVIMVMPVDDSEAADERTDMLGTLPTNNNRTLSAGVGAQFQSLQTTGGSGIPPDSLDDTGRKVAGLLGTDDGLLFRLPHQDAVEYDDLEDISVEEIA